MPGEVPRRMGQRCGIHKRASRDYQDPRWTVAKEQVEGEFLYS
jgi:hypothetical protein